MVPMENVEVINAGGARQRWRYDPHRDTGSSGEFLALQRSVADERTLRAQDALDELYPGKTRVLVSIELDPLWEIKNEKILPTEPIAVSDSSTEDTTETPAPVRSEGDPSISAALATPAASGTKNKKETRDRKFLEDIGDKRSGKFAPEIRRLSVALLYDRSLEQQAGFDKTDLINIVKRSVGYDDARDGEGGFSSLSGDFPAEQSVELVAAGPGMGEFALQWAPIIGQVLGVGLVLLFLKSLLKRGSGASSGGDEAASLIAAKADENLTDEEQQQRLRREIERAITADPAALARMLESWMTEARA